MDDHVPVYLNVSNPPQFLTNSDSDDINDYIFNIVLNDTESASTFTPGDGNFSANSSSTYSSPAYIGLGDNFDAIYDDWSSSSPHPPELWFQDAPLHLAVPRSLPRRYSESGESSNSSIESSTDMYPGLRRHTSASSLGICRNDRQISEMSQNVGRLSLEDNPPYHDMVLRGREGPGSSLVTGSSSYGGNTALLIPIQTPATDNLPFWSPAPSGPSSPISTSSSLAPTDGMAGMGNANLGRTRSTRSIQASLSRRKGPGKFVCDICRDNFTTKHRLKGE
ncbi:hypothetical protein DFS33DRAFT_1274004 [Desarmillaria ectypa]|nr:hypothetical protein DFS33DRAFT_1274004 [Desarmillaria ectypa]